MDGTGGMNTMEQKLASLAEISARVGADRLLVQAAGGNTSIKLGDTLWIKASGQWLADALAKPIFVPVDFNALRSAFEAGEDVERFEPGDHDRHPVALREGRVLAGAHHAAHVPGGQEPLHPAARRLHDRSDRRRHQPPKHDVLSVHWTMVGLGALPAEGDRMNWSPKRVTQYRMSGGMGVSRSTFTRKVSRMANPHGNAALDPQSHPEFHAIQRNRGFAVPNEYAIGPSLPARASRPRHGAAETVCYPSVEDLRSHPRSRHLFSGGARADGYKPIPIWMFDQRLPLSSSARLVMIYYFMCGLLENGECHPKQSTTAEAVGLSVRTVRRANAEIAAAGLIRVAHPKPKKRADGRIERGPQIIVYLPLRTMSEEEALEERGRLLGARNRLQARYAAFWDRIVDTHGAMLRQWTGKEHCIAPVRRAVREELARRGVPRETVKVLFPFQPSD